MKVSAFTIIRQEEDLVTHIMAHLASLGDEVVVIVQPSTDATLMFVNMMADKLFKPCRVIEHTPESPGWEFSLRKALQECKYDWCFGLTADETYVGAPLRLLAKHAKSKNLRAAAIRRLHAVACNPTDFFKFEHPEKRAEVRLVHKQVALNGDGFVYALHRGLNHQFNGKAVLIPWNDGRILELKSTVRHYKGQLFCDDAGVLNERTQCEEKMPARDLRIGQSLWERMQP